MKKASTRNLNEGSEGMTDKQFLHHLKELLALAKRSNNLDEFIAELEKLIATYSE